MIIYTIYKAVNTINGKVYIGFDSNWPSRKYGHYYKHLSSSCPEYVFYKALKKYEWKNFIFEAIYQSKDLIHCKNIMENYFICENRSYIGFTDCNGYNMTLGGEGTFGKYQTEKNKKIISEKIKKRNKKSKWYNDGKQNKFSEFELGNDWKRGRLNQKPTTKGYKWYNNGIEQKLTNNPPDGWKQGMIKYSGIRKGYFKRGHVHRNRKTISHTKIIMTPSGKYDSILEACKFYKIKPSTMSYRLKKYPNEYYIIGIKK